MSEVREVPVVEVARGMEIKIYRNSAPEGHVWADLTWAWYDPASVMFHTHVVGEGTGSMFELPNNTMVEVRDGR